jgi:hypothetical protein
MKNFQLEGSGLRELSTSEQQQVNGGIGLLLLAALGGLVSCYNIGKIVGEEVYEVTH